MESVAPPSAKQDPHTDPILCHPYAAPNRHWDLDWRGRATDTINKGRRPSTPTLAIVPGATPIGKDDDQTHARINKIRHLVDKWRNNDWQGSTSASKTLLAHWHDSTDPRLYWAQIEAVETLIWLSEVAPQVKDGRQILHSIDKFNAEHCGGLPRISSKMATGTGKTTVMALVIAWQTCNASVDPTIYASQFVIISPSTTIRERLALLDPCVPENIYDQGSLLPPIMRSRLGSTIVEVCTYHAFQQRNALSTLNATATERRVLVEHARDIPKEAMPDMLRRVLRNRIDFSAPFVVINDEGHHCYKPGTARVRRENERDRAKAALWFRTLTSMMAEGGGTNMLSVHDFSATPRFIERGEARTDSLFPWTVSDFPLADAIESGLVKIPRVPLGKEGVDVNACRNIYQNTPDDARNLDADCLPEQVEAPLKALYSDYERVFDSWKKANWNVPPVFVMVANTIENAKELARYASGGMENGTWSDGHFKLFSNRPDKPLRTLLVHSNLNEDDLSTSDIKKMDVTDAVSRLGRSAVGNLSGLEALREALDTIGQQDQLGAHIRCVVSVSMLTEGWDAKNVTHIFGFRRFGTQLICEQVVGRALRRPDTESAGWHCVPRYAEIFGVPFDYMLDTVENNTDERPPGKSVASFVASDPSLAIEFPLVTRYNWLGTSNIKVVLNRGRVSPFELVEEELTGEVGDIKSIDMSPCTDLESTTWLLASEAVKKLSKDSDIDRGDLFCKLVPIVAEWIDRAITRKAHDPVWLCALSNRSRATDSIILACDIISASSLGCVPPLPVVAKTETTANKPYMTTVPDDDYVYDCPRRCSHTSAPCHSKLEARVASVLDRLPDVQAWMRNHPKIGWAIPYYHDGSWRLYQPDFIARLVSESTTVYCLVEVKGQEDDESRAKLRFAKDVWIKAINAEAEYGKWAFVQVDDEKKVRQALAIVIREEARK